MGGREQRRPRWMQVRARGWKGGEEEGEGWRVERTKVGGERRLRWARRGCRQGAGGEGGGEAVDMVRSTWRRRWGGMVVIERETRRFRCWRGLEYRGGKGKVLVGGAVVVVCCGCCERRIDGVREMASRQISISTREPHCPPHHALKYPTVRPFSVSDNTKDDGRSTPSLILAINR